MKVSDNIIYGLKSPPLSLATRSMRLAAQRRRRRCGNGMGSRVVTTLSTPHVYQGWLRTLLVKIKQQRRGFTGVFEVGGRRHFLEIEDEKEAHSTRIRAVVWASRGRGDPDGLEAFGVVTRGQLALGASDAPRDYNSSVFCTRQRHCGTAAREHFADRHKTVARLPTVAALASK